jgi:hypothetical protein
MNPCHQDVYYVLLHKKTKYNLWKHTTHVHLWCARQNAKSVMFDFWRSVSFHIRLIIDQGMIIVETIL